VCLWNEPKWCGDPWVPGVIGFIENPTAQDHETYGTDGMHHMLATFFGYQAPAGVRFISGATDKAGLAGSVLRMYGETNIANRGKFFIKQPTAAELGTWLTAEGVHP